MISQAIFRRVFRIRIYQKTGTAFSFEVEGRQYLATAKHLLGGLESVEAIEIRIGDAWTLLPVTTVGSAQGDVDVAVFALKIAVTVSPAWTGSGKDCFVSQDVFFLGFPLGLATEPLAHDDGTPIAFVKKACFSAIIWRQDGAKALYLDGTNNEGFSGGPVIAPTVGAALGVCKVVGVISGYRHRRLPVENDAGRTSGFVRENIGIIVSYAIEHAVDIAKANPVGFQLPA